MNCKDKISLNKVTHSVRASQAVLQYGVGAMVDFPEQTLMTAAPELWEAGVTEIHDERLEKVLGVGFFGMPGDNSQGISYARFPEWYFCPKCRKFQPLTAWIKEYRSNTKNKNKIENDQYMVKHLKCSTCYQDLVVARIVTACGHGHIDDFPWVKWVHAKNFYGAKSVCDNPKLEFKTSSSSSEGLEGITIVCKNCGARATLKGAFDKGAFKKLDEKTDYKYDFSCTGRHPWKNSKEKCNEYPHVLQRGGSSVYFPITFSSLVIPPYSSKLTSEIQKSIAYSDLRKAIKESLKTLEALSIEISQEQKEQVKKDKISEYIDIISKEIGKPKEQVKSILLRKFDHQDDEYTVNSISFRAEEYSALSGRVTSTDNAGDFVRESVNIEEYNLPTIKNISLINKVREVQALVGYSRLEPIDVENNSSAEARISSVSIKEDSTDWYPGYEVRGEGIFIEFDENIISNWMYNNPSVQERVNHINENYHNSFFGEKRPRIITAKFLLLHTISHLLMKQLSFECGYSIASLKERIYCSEVADGEIMSGILIYTASGDSEGTLGGLVRQGHSDTFPKIFENAIEGAKTCSNDPVCSLSMGQGRDSLNLAACYSCTLVPETSCEEYNVFLDRGVVIGTVENPNMGFYSNSIDTEMLYKRNKETAVSSSSKKTLKITDKGINIQNMEFKTVCLSILQFANSELEKNAINEIVEHESDFLGLEKPYKDASFSFDLVENYEVDLAWINARVLLFTGENEEEYKLAQESDWKCYCLNSKEFSYKELVRILKGE